MNASPRTTDPFADMLDYLRIGGTEVELATGETIIHKGDPGVAVYFILAGEVEVRLPGAAQRVAAALAVLAWGPLMATQFRHIPLLEDLYIRSESGASWLGPFTEGVTFLTLASVGVVLFAAAASALILWRTRKRCSTELRPIAPPAWSGITAVWLVSLLLSLALVL